MHGLGPDGLTFPLMAGSNALNSNDGTSSFAGADANARDAPTVKFSIKRDAVRRAISV